MIRRGDEDGVNITPLQHLFVHLVGFRAREFGLRKAAPLLVDITERDKARAALPRVVVFENYGEKVDSSDHPFLDEYLRIGRSYDRVSIEVHRIQRRFCGASASRRLENMPPGWQRYRTVEMLRSAHHNIPTKGSPVSVTRHLPFRDLARAPHV